jgi:hypothetical protein
MALTETELHEYMRALCGGPTVNELPRHILNLHLRSGLDLAMDALDASRETDPYSFALEEDVYEYPVPADVHQVEWITWNGTPLTLGTTDDWIRQNRDWRNATSSTPTDIAIDGRTFVLFPPPSADAIDTAGFVVYRFLREYRITPAGIPGLPDADARLAVMLGALEWMGANNADGRHDRRIASLNGVVKQRLGDAASRAIQPLDGQMDVIPAWNGLQFQSR